MLNYKALNPQSFNCSPSGHKKQKNYELSTTFFQRSRGKIDQSHKQNKTYMQKILHTRDQFYNKNLTFSPHIHQMPYNIYANGSKKINISRQQLREKMIQDATKKIRSRIKQKLSQQKRQQKNCTFKPQISQNSRMITTSIGNSEPIYIKLYNEAEEIKQRKLQVQLNKIQQENQQIEKLCNYKLRTSKNILNKQKHDLNPIQKRIDQILQNRIILQRKLQSQYKQENKISFHPQLNKKSEEYALNKMQRQKLKSNVVQRLFQQYQRMKKNKQYEFQMAKMNEQKQCTFSPQINKNYTFNRYGRAQTERNYYLSGRMQQNTENNFPFKPQINKLSNLIVMHSRVDQNLEQKINRLTYQPTQRKRQKVQKMRQQIEVNLTFTPKLNQISCLISPQHKIHRCQEPAQQVFPFRPKINQKSRLIRPQSVQLNKMKAKKKLLEYKLQSQYQELKQCSFQPKINLKRHQDERKLTEVQGIANYINTQQKARQKIKIQKQRQKQLFNLQYKYDQRKRNNQHI